MRGGQERVMEVDKITTIKKKHTCVKLHQASLLVIFQASSHPCVGLQIGATVSGFMWVLRI